ncbi:ABC transporter ATP-binding protein [Mesorhizobium sp. J428]|uniref:dipeptide ABC transporter ATP-binding protein n=1 Tax=Mesorhizobium sp. J428 TaxID=2898440 RepID=UPI0021515A46|nr:ABC transporter ATP-binding protein [Mesorhizobium sp. J428]MCR5855733.1 ABC transporter ATP-binding protein [Mesorhizobium sp. J428]
MNASVVLSPGVSDAVRLDPCEPLLDIRNLTVEFRSARGSVRAIDDLSLKVSAGEFLAIVGESGSGKSVTALSIMRLLPTQTALVSSGSVRFDGRDLLQLSPEEMRQVRGKDIGMVFQEPMSSLNPILTIGFQITESLKVHFGLSDEKADARAIELLGMVGIPDAERRLKQYPHQFSGGMRQRVMIAIALACNPKLIIADEPTTALDVTVQVQILDLMRDLARRLNVALIVITHNLAVVARYADRIAVMYAGQLVEVGDAMNVFTRSRHVYTQGLLRSVPRLDEPRRARLESIEGLPPNLAQLPTGCRFAPRCPLREEACSEAGQLTATDVGTLSACRRHAELAAGRIGWPSEGGEGQPPDVAGGETLISIRNLVKTFPVASGFGRPTAHVRAVQNFSIDIHKGETLGLVGESGCGKSTVGRLLLRLEEPSEGTVTFEGKDVHAASGRQLTELRRKIQVIFQDPFSSLNPRMTVGDIIREPLQVYRLAPDRAAREARLSELLSQVGLRPEVAERYPHQLSGGQRQRVGIARALALEPSFIVCDEAVSALDVSIQGQIINLLEDLQRRLGLTYLFIAHDLAVVRHISTRVVVMYLGRIMEIADRDELYARPIHPYTATLMEVAPTPDPVKERAKVFKAVKGDLPSPLNAPSGCVFHTRCPKAGPECRQTVPALREIRPGHFAACIKV